MPGTAKEWMELAQKTLDVKRETPVDREDCEVSHPVHYNTGAIECIEAIRASMSPEAFQGYLKGNTLKYLWRYSYKGKPLQDLQKAMWYLQHLITELAK